MRIFWPFARLNALLPVNRQVSSQFFVQISGAASTSRQVPNDVSQHAASPTDFMTGRRGILLPIGRRQSTTIMKHRRLSTALLQSTCRLSSKKCWSFWFVPGLFGRCPHAEQTDLQTWRAVAYPLVIC
jgi:hypothetical protein